MDRVIIEILKNKTIVCVQVITDFIKKDPYVINGLVPSFSIREWNVVVGKNL